MSFASPNMHLLLGSLLAYSRSCPPLLCSDPPFQARLEIQSVSVGDRDRKKKNPNTLLIIVLGVCYTMNPNVVGLHDARMIDPLGYLAMLAAPTSRP